MEYDSPKFKKWLDKLQQESWQLELIISGFAIYGLFVSLEPIGLKAQLASNDGNGTALFTWAIASIATYILLFNLVLHVLLRGLWIGAIGLRYVSGDIDYDRLNYSEKFTSFLKRKVGSFDKYIATLENYCSVLFAISFLLTFYIIGALLTLILLGYCFDLVAKIAPDNDIIAFVVLCIMILMVLAIFIVFLDFVGQGFLKRKKWTSKIYFPIYWVFGFLTLSFLYRPLVYNFLDNRLGRRLSLFLVPIYAAIVFLNSLNYRSSNYLFDISESSRSNVLNQHYEDLSLKENTFTKTAFIPSKIIEKNYLKVFMLFTKDIEDFIFEKDSTLIPKKDRRGYETSIIVDFKSGLDKVRGKKDTTAVDSYLKTLNQLYSLKIDSVHHQSDFIVSRNRKKRLGFETYLNLKGLSEGKHILTITGPAKEIPMDEESATIEQALVEIPFWYFPQNSSTSSNLPEIESDTATNK